MLELNAAKSYSVKLAMEAGSCAVHNRCAIFTQRAEKVCWGENTGREYSVV